MKWLQWSKDDLACGNGGVETHARSVDRELKKRGIDAFLSKDPEDLFKPCWDVIHTHGSGVPISLNLRAHLQRKNAKWIHTLHGSTLERMWACKEYFWPGGYLAYAREWAGILGADCVFAIRKDISGLKMVSKLRPLAICSNGWDAWSGEEKSLPFIDKLKMFMPFWLFIGRGSDFVKGTWLLEEVLKKNPSLNLVVAPGEGFGNHPRILKTNVLNPSQIQLLLGLSEGLFLTSLYEGLPLVVLEALSLGVPVVTTKVGGLKSLNADLQNIFYAENPKAEDIERAWLRARQSAQSQSRSTHEIQKHNRSLLKTWKDVTDIYVKKTAEL